MLFCGFLQMFRVILWYNCLETLLSTCLLCCVVIFSLVSWWTTYNNSGCSSRKCSKQWVEIRYIISSTEKHSNNNKTNIINDNNNSNDNALSIDVKVLKFCKCCLFYTSKSHFYCLILKFFFICHNILSRWTNPHVWFVSRCSWIPKRRASWLSYNKSSTAYLMIWVQYLLSGWFLASTYVWNCSPNL